MIETFRFTLKTQSTMNWPTQAGSMLRGAFGHTLKRLSCMTKQPVCKNCPLVNTCPYTAIFETQARTNQTNRPSPYIIQPLPSATRAATHQFDLTLIGKDTLNQLPLIFYAWENALAGGLTKHAIPAKLHQVTHQNTCLVDNGVPLTLAFEPTPLPQANPQNQTLNITIKTPMRLEQRNQLIGQAEFSLNGLFTHIIRRNKFMFQHHLPETSFNFAINLANLSDAKPHQQTLTWQDWQRYSNRQQQAMTLGGLVGQIQLKPHTLTPQQYQQLQIVQRINIGKHTVFGMGAIELQ
ncbi:CRISPR system precrRNA processing endoribonuclease RAMP protein Cas6 [Thiomicrospira sp. R3]|uniref:CRISPR system precrRNA processing endoribonuclease RAMP protein Cas6 n=1 Tax=Thiomicrospira sp. R3 TaxID=3035472 RepID=UPI00259B3DFB|nr:CRISPR system precrRNA processing endoribonuclease RAMP protein Cas6 [Thiomicrospira sp. R3]WFE69480.1 CRISPR system precrRNA processing endoribonuclease RAMP protein Cas6 [Thiomicrospira sp. R3]